MAERTEVKMGDYRVAKGGTLTGAGIGSCLLICLYDPRTRTGAMAHAMLPSHGEQGESAKFADSAIRIMLAGMAGLGADRKDIKARLVGGARMFRTQNRDNALDIGAKNVKAAKETLQQENIPLAGEDTGGTHGRSAEFDLASGVITVKTIL